MIEMTEGGTTNMEVEKRGTVIDITCQNERVFVRANRIRETLGHGFAEITISADLPIGDSYQRKRLVPKTRIDLLDINARDKMIRGLDEQTQDYQYLYWGTLINDLFEAIIDKHREGEPEIVMDNLGKVIPRTYAVRPLFVNNVANLIWAPGGSAKSYFGLLSCVMVDRGLNIMGMRARQGTALYLDREEEPEVFKHRLLAVQRGLNIPNYEHSTIIRKNMRLSGPLVNNIEEISRIVADRNVTYVVIDSVGPALNGSGNNQEVVEEYFAALGILGVTTLSIDHANRAGETTGNWQIHGSAFKYARARQVYEVRKVQEENAGELQVILHHRKSNDSGIKSPRGFEVSFKMEEVYNNLEDDYEKHLHTVYFNTIGLTDSDDDNVLNGATVGDIVHELIKKNGEQPLVTIATKVGIIKDAEVSTDAIENSLRNSTVLKIENNKVILIEEEAEWTA